MNINITLRNAIVSLMFLLLITPMVVATSLFFPYITGKGFLFRICVEIAFALYLVLIIRDRSYLPKKSFLTWSLLAFMVVMAIATALSANPAKSFWSNYERMEGYVTMLHLAAYFVILATVFGKRLWNWFLNSSLVISIITGGYAYISDRFAATPVERIQGPLGNSTYLGIYALIHVFLAIFLALRLIEEKGGFKKVVWPVVVYVLAAIFDLFIVYSTGTRGSFVGFVAGAVVAGILIAIFEKNRRLVRKWAIGALAAVVLVVALLGSIKHTSFVQNSPLLSRFSSLITFNVGSVLEEQGYARSLIWGMALKGFEERPVFGWGQESFNYVFAKYYNPEMYNQEQWFDRSHNVFFDWLIAGGILGLLAYLSLFVGIFYLIWKKPKHTDETWTIAEKAVLSGLLVAYFVHNIFVFDNLVSYLAFFALLAYAHHRSTSHGEHKHGAALIVADTNQIVAAVVIAAAMIVSLYYVVYLPYEQNIDLIDAMRASQGVSAEGTQLTGGDKGAQTLAYFQKALATNAAYGRPEVLERMAETGPSIVTDASNSEATITGYENMIQSEFAKEFAETPNDPRPYMFMGLYLLQTSRTDAAIVDFQKAEALSPNKQTFLIQLAVAYFAKKDFTDALPLAQKAYELEKNNQEALAIYVTLSTYANQGAQADALIAEGQARGIDVSTDPRYLQALVDTKDNGRLIKAAEAEIAAKPNDAQTRVSAAAIFLKAGDRQDAIAQLQAAIKIEPQFQAQGESYIKTIQNGGDPSTATQTQQ